MSNESQLDTSNIESRLREIGRLSGQMLTDSIAQQRGAKIVKRSLLGLCGFSATLPAEVTSSRLIKSNVVDSASKATELMESLADLGQGCDYGPGKLYVERASSSNPLIVGYNIRACRYSGD